MSDKVIKKNQISCFHFYKFGTVSTFYCTKIQKLYGVKTENTNFSHKNVKKKKKIVILLGNDCMNN